MCHEMYWRRGEAKEARKAEAEKAKESAPQIKSEERKERVPELA
jgi:hypothetical protein